VFASRLEFLRKQRKLTHQQMAEKLGITRQAYSNYENGKREPDLKTLEGLCDIFDVKMDYLLGRTDDPSPTDKKNKPYDFTHEELRILEEMKKYPVFFNDLASDPSKIKKVIKMWEFIKTDLENDDDEEPED
jgi:transcriptional regulator with XRE-family HTH domain